MHISNQTKLFAAGQRQDYSDTALSSPPGWPLVAELSRPIAFQSGQLSVIGRVARRVLYGISPSCSICFGFILGLLVLVNCPPIVSARDLFSISCTTESIYDVTISAPVPGTISTIYLKEGDSVEKNQSILEQDKQLEVLEVQRRKLILESKEEVIVAKESAAVLKMVFDSALELFNSTRSVSREELKKAELEYRLAQAEYMKLEVGEKREQIEYEIALENLDRKIVKSPLRGVITKLYLEEGESCDQREPLVDIVDTSRCLMVCNVEENVGRTLKKGGSVDVTVNVELDTIEKKGKIVYVSPVVDSASNLMKVKVEFDNRDGAIRPGASGSMHLKNR